MKTLIATTAALLLSSTIASAQLTNLDAGYRIWSAEQMIQRIAEKMVRSRKACIAAEPFVGQRLSEQCIASIVGTYPVLGQIREIARRNDPVEWARVIDAVHKLEVEIEGPLNTLERR